MRPPSAAAGRGRALHLPGLQLLPPGRRGAGRADAAGGRPAAVLPRDLLGSAWLAGHLRPRGEHRAAADYARHLGRGDVYTPQMVIGGRIESSARKRSRARGDRPVAAARAGPADRDRGERPRLGAGPADDADLAVRVDREHEVCDRARREPRPRLRYHNVVRESPSSAAGRARCVELALPLQRLAAAGRDSAAVVVQRRARRDPGGSPDRAPRALGRHPIRWDRRIVVQMDGVSGGSDGT